MSTLQPTVAIGESFLRSLTALPEGIMKKARETITKFQRDPTSPGLNYETINNVKDDRLRSIRIDRDYRCIVLKAEKGDTYILLWVDKHDEAYAWAERRTCTVNRQTGSIQVMEIQEGTAEPEAAAPAPPPKREDKKPGVFDPFSDKDLRQIGATDELIPLIRSIKEEPALEALERRFPSLLYEALYMLACGEPYESVLDELGIDTGKEFEPDDFQLALDLDANRQHFQAITDDADLEAMLNEPLALWRVFLHPSQRKLVRANFNGPARVLGGAGTGKTVVAMHRAKFLASGCTENERILFTTFTKSLINDIKNNLQKICSYDEIKKIEIVHLDSWCLNFLRARKYQHEVTYARGDGAGHARQSKLWEAALEKVETGDFSSEFLREEWDKVIQYHDIESLADYVRIPRTGRKGRLSRTQRSLLWPVFQEYRTLLAENHLWEPPDMMRAARTVLEAGEATSGFRHLIVDEIQDFHPQAFRLFRAMVPPGEGKKNDLFLVGDGHQNIYGHHIVLSKLGVNIRGRGRRLKLNYRTPEETRRWATSILKGIPVNDLDGSADTERGYRSLMHGPEPTFQPCDSFEDEVKTIAAWFKDLKAANPNHVACLALRTNRDRDTFAQALRDKEIPLHLISDKQHDTTDPAPLRVATMHRIKGLEFDHVALAGLRTATWGSLPEERQEQEKYLLHVAATRTKNSLLVAGADMAG